MDTLLKLILTSVFFSQIPRDTGAVTLSSILRPVTGVDSRYRIMNPTANGFGILTWADVYTVSRENYAQIDDRPTREKMYMETTGAYFNTGQIFFTASETEGYYIIAPVSYPTEILVVSPEEISPEPDAPDGHYLIYSKNERFKAGGDKRNYAYWSIGVDPSGTGMFQLINNGGGGQAQIVRPKYSLGYTWLKVPTQSEVEVDDTFFQVSAVPFQSPNQEATRTIKNLYSGRCLSVNNTATTMEARMVIWDCDAGFDSLQWSLVKVSQGKYLIINKHSSLCLTIARNFDATRDNFAFVEQNVCETTDSALKTWELENVANSEFGEVLVKLMDTFCLDVGGWGKENGNEMVIWKCHGGEIQRFVIDPPVV